MRRILRISAFITALILMLSSFTAFAADSYFTMNGFTFSVNSSREAEIHSYDDRSADVVIPRKLINADVVGIADSAFFGDTAMKSLSFEKSTALRKIGDNAFYGCTGITELSIPYSVTEMGFGAFQDCTGLKRVSMSGGITKISEQAFLNCTALELVSLSDDVQTIGSYAFGNCTSLKSVIIPAGVTQIDPDAFSGCSSSLTIYGEDGSYAQTYAAENGISFELLYSFDLGDVNRDGAVNVTDATVIQKFNVGLAQIKPYAGVQLADVNRDGDVNIRDATLIQMYAARIITSFE